MRAFLFFGCLVLTVWAEEKELIMLEIETFGDGNGQERTLTKRSPQAETQYGGQQYVLGATGQSPPEIPAEYLNFLHQLQAERGISSQQVHPSDIQQVIISRNPYQQDYVNPTQQQQPQRQRLSPQNEEQRILQLQRAQKARLEQEVKDAQRQQLRQYYQQQGFPAGTYQLQPQIASQSYQPQVHTQPQVQHQLVPQPTLQYYQAAQQPQPQAYFRPAHEQISYTQVQLGIGGQQAVKPQSLASQAQPTPQPQPQLQSLVYRVRPTTEAPKSAAPQQYLIETTKPEDQVVAVPRPVLYYRPQPQYTALPSPFVNSQPSQYAEQQQGSAFTSPSRSSIYVSRTTVPEDKQVRIQTAQGQARPLTQIELKALIDAGFKISPQDAGQDYLSAYTAAPQTAYYRGFAAGKRQSKPVPRPVPLSKQERVALAQQGIRNLYTVDTAESQDTPVTYILALGKPQNS